MTGPTAASQTTAPHGDEAARAASGPRQRLLHMPRALRGTVRFMTAPLRKLSFSQQFMLVSLLILVVGAFVIGRWVANEIERGVVNRTAAVTALYVDSFISPHLQELDQGTTVPQDQLTELDQLLSTSALGQKIVSFKIWSTDGHILYASDRSLLGQSFEVKSDLRTAIDGGVSAHISGLEDDENESERQRADTLVETYAPVHSHATNRVIGVMEFYQSPAEIEAEVQNSQRDGWLIVGVSTAIMYLLLVGLVNGASRTITSQNRQLRGLLQHNAALSERVQHAAARKAQTDEQLMMRIGHELHDGPAQELSLALLRLEGLRDELAARAPAAGEDNDFIVVQGALERSLREIRGIASGLRLPELDALTLTEVIHRAVDEHERRTGDVVDLTLAGLPEGALAALKIAVYRIIKESLNNSHRHAGVTAARVSVSLDQDVLALDVSDSGAGFDPQSIDTRVSLGLRGMRERAELLGGSLAVVSRPGEGTVVTARLPLTERGV